MQLRRNATPFSVSPSANPAGNEGDDGSAHIPRQLPTGRFSRAAERRRAILALASPPGFSCARSELRRRRIPRSRTRSIRPSRMRAALGPRHRADGANRLPDRAGAPGRRPGDGGRRAGREAETRARELAAELRAAERSSTGCAPSTPPRSSSSRSGWSRSMRATHPTSSRSSSTRTATTTSPPAPPISTRSTTPTGGSPSRSHRCATRSPRTSTRWPT